MRHSATISANRKYARVLSKLIDKEIRKLYTNQQLKTATRT